MNVTRGRDKRREHVLERENKGLKANNDTLKEEIKNLKHEMNDAGLHK